MINLIEPTRGITLVKTLHTLMVSNPILTKTVPILADIFVFSYPIYLLGLYSQGWIKKTIQPKIGGMLIGVNIVASVIINIGIQFFVNKDRPNIVLGLIDKKHETVLHQFLPTSSFPSDHAAVSMSIAIASILRGITNKDKKYLWFGVVGVFFSIIMCSARVMTAVHWPTDIIGGMLVGIIVPMIIMFTPLQRWIKKPITRIAKKV